MLGLALKLSPTEGLLGAFIWGYIMDVFSGKFLGLHVGTYLIVVRSVHATMQKIEFHNPFYQMSFILLCVLGQSIVLGLFLWIKAPVPLVMESFLKNLGIRSLITTILTPLVVSPILRMR
jgi:rod shape-determining protein MreD